MRTSASRYCLLPCSLRRPLKVRPRVCHTTVSAVDGIVVVGEGHLVEYREGRLGDVVVMLLFDELMSESGEGRTERTIF